MPSLHFRYWLPGAIAAGLLLFGLASPTAFLALIWSLIVVGFFGFMTYAVIVDARRRATLTPKERAAEDEEDHREMNIW